MTSVRRKRSPIPLVQRTINVSIIFYLILSLNRRLLHQLTAYSPFLARKIPFILGDLPLYIMAGEARESVRCSEVLFQDRAIC